MKALIVGGSGYLGAAVAQVLERDHNATALVLSRSGQAPVGTALTGDVTMPSLAIPSSATRLLDGLTHIISCFGSVSWTAGPRAASELHRDGTRAVLDFAASTPSVERVVHVSSILALGVRDGTSRQLDLDVGQRFRNWYEYGKFLAEYEATTRTDLPVRVMRLGPLLGTGGPVAPPANSGLPAALPSLLRGYPVHLRDHGRFPCYVGDVVAAARVVVQAALAPQAPPIATWFDARQPTLAQVLFGLCAPWGVCPRIINSPTVGRLMGVLGGRLGAPQPLSSYAVGWPHIPTAVLEELPGEKPLCTPGYIEETGADLRRRASQA